MKLNLSIIINNSNLLVVAEIGFELRTVIPKGPKHSSSTSRLDFQSSSLKESHNPLGGTEFQ
jgi:hypothetical protein